MIQSVSKMLGDFVPEGFCPRDVLSWFFFSYTRSRPRYTCVGRREWPALCFPNT